MPPQWLPVVISSFRYFAACDRRWSKPEHPGPSVLAGSLSLTCAKMRWTPYWVNRAFGPRVRSAWMGRKGRAWRSGPCEQWRTRAELFWRLVCSCFNKRVTWSDLIFRLMRQAAGWRMDWTWRGRTRGTDWRGGASRSPGNSYRCLNYGRGWENGVEIKFRRQSW